MSAAHNIVAVTEHVPRAGTPAPDARFWAKVNKRGPVSAARPDLGRCWLWRGTKTEGGYGQCKRARRQWFTHRVAYTAARGRIPDGLELDHLCRTRACCNPRHLEAVTRRVNVLRGDGAARLGAMHAAKTHCPKGHEYTPENTFLDLHGGRTRRRCRTCRRTRSTQ